MSAAKERPIAHHSTQWHSQKYLDHHYLIRNSDCFMQSLICPPLCTWPHRKTTKGIPGFLIQLLRDDLLYTVRCVQLDATYSIELLQLAMYASLCQQQWSCPTVDRFVQSLMFSDILFVGSLSCNGGYNLDQIWCLSCNWLGLMFVIALEQ